MISMVQDTEIKKYLVEVNKAGGEMALSAIVKAIYLRMVTLGIDAFRTEDVGPRSSVWRLSSDPATMTVEYGSGQTTVLQVNVSAKELAEATPKSKAKGGKTRSC